MLRSKVEKLKGAIARREDKIRRMSKLDGKDAVQLLEKSSSEYKEFVDIEIGYRRDNLKKRNQRLKKQLERVKEDNKLYRENLDS